MDMDEVKRKYREQKRKTETFVISLIAIMNTQQFFYMKLMEKRIVIVH